MPKTNTDSRVLELKTKIAEKKAIVEKTAVKFTPTTTCILVLDGQTYHIQTINANDLTLLLLKLWSYHLAAADLAPINPPMISGFSLGSWIDDIQARLEYIKFLDLKKELATADEQLNKMLSEGKKTEIALDELAGRLGL